MNLYSFDRLPWDNKNSYHCPLSSCWQFRFTVPANGRADFIRRNQPNEHRMYAIANRDLLIYGTVLHMTDINTCTYSYTVVIIKVP